MNGPFSDGTEQNVATPSHLQRPQAFEKSNVRTQQMLSPCSQCMKAKDVLCEPRAVVRGKRNVPSRDGKTTRGCRTRSREKSVISPTRAPPRRSPSVRRIRKVCEDWVVQLREDAEAVQQALQTVVILLSTQRQVLNAKECNGASQLHTFRRERQQCTQIIKNSGMLQDTEVPVEAVEFFAFTPEELNCVRADDSTLQDARDTMGMIADVNDTLAGKRREALNCIRLIGDAKTCLRYIVLLIEEENDRSLYKYVDEVTEFMTCEKEKLDRIEAMYTRA
uniref:WGS project CAEQ00000000 data, annotated contig 729 n=1 Tax=Trypanosoma congolense (strain IL3000) TaxID=1068625 RepID=F9WI42_TRYCI|nr:unnamed protein product [Trypanosoma congolense IL3000]